MAVICNPKDEALEAIWQLAEREKKINLENIISKNSLIREDILNQLIEDNLIKKDGKKYSFTEAGSRKARLLVRRHRLAERLLSDVLEMDEKFLEEQACEFEHIISSETEESICTLLNHPDTCPHGATIPPGECCRQAKKNPRRVVVTLNELKTGESGKILYYHGQHKNMHQLANLGVVPGAVVVVHQKYPSAIIMSGETNIALDRDILKKIYVRQVSTAGYNK